MNLQTHDPALRRALIENELAARRGQRGTLQTELDRCIQTRDEPHEVMSRLADLDAEILRLQHTLGED